MSREAFDRTFAAGRSALLTGEYRRQSPPVEGGFRWGLSALLRPDPSAAAILDALAHQAAAAAGGSHWISGAAGTSHLTLRSLEPWREAESPLLDRYASALAEAAADFGPLTFTITGLTLTPGSVMACGIPTSGEAERLAAAYGKALGPDGWHEKEIDREFWYVNLLHYADTVATPHRLIDWVAAHRKIEPMTVTVHDVQLTSWRYTGAGMRPHVAAAIKLTGRTT